MPAPSRTFPIEPLLELIPEPPAPLTRLGVVRKALGIDQRNQARMTRGLTWVTADRAACRLGYHPAEIWPDLWTYDR